MTTPSVRSVTLPPLPRRWDLLLLGPAVLLIMAGMHMESMLFAGDWSFWVDWKDRQWWPLLTPTVNIILPAAIQYIAWSKLRIPAGATLAAFCLVGAQWISRVGSFEWWAHLPLNYVWPETMILTAILMDVALLYSRSYLVTSIVGSLFWGGLFWAANWPALAPFLQPVIYHGYVLTVADVISFETPRSQGPEYLRMIEEGHLRALVGNVTAIVAFFAAMLCAACYWIGIAIGKFIGVLPATKFFRL
ncbi:MAG: methane monooxygenase/ammonia monooxygenase subunit A, partial [Dehalococcoidia bacterium]